MHALNLSFMGAITCMGWRPTGNLGLTARVTGGARGRVSGVRSPRDSPASLLSLREVCARPAGKPTSAAKRLWVGGLLFLCWPQVMREFVFAGFKSGLTDCKACTQEFVCVFVLFLVCCLLGLLVDCPSQQSAHRTHTQAVYKFIHI